MLATCKHISLLRFCGKVSDVFHCNAILLLTAHCVLPMFKLVCVSTPDVFGFVQCRILLAIGGGYWNRILAHAAGSNIDQRAKL